MNDSDSPEHPQAVQDCHALLAWIIPQLDKMPRLRRYTLGERLETLLLQVLEVLWGLVVSAKHGLCTRTLIIEDIVDGYRLTEGADKYPFRTQARSAENLGDRWAACLSAACSVRLVLQHPQIFEHHK